MLLLDVQRDDSIAHDSPDDHQLERAARAALAAACSARETAARESAEISLRLVGEAEMRELNGRYRGRDYATNVLAFPAALPEGLPDDVELSLLGDIVICAPVVRREAHEQNKDEAAHWDHMLVHGVLHLLGFDHEDDDEAEHMEATERHALADLGHGDPYEESSVADGAASRPVSAMSIGAMEACP
ncbi:MAG: rRNA maturation RNase YbeY [Halieaceae bacterium]|jgi:probable rRNA maturation factor|nr:rRNA maturation RNase YbeY [Halieaceae bacterium]